MRRKIFSAMALLALLVLPILAPAQTCPNYVKIGNDHRITNNSASSGEPSFAWNGSEYGLNWSDFRDDLDGLCSYSSGPRDCNYEIYFARIALTGTAIGQDLRITNDSGPSNYPSLVWTGSQYGVSWLESGGEAIYFVQISANGSKIGNDYLIPNSGSFFTGIPSLVWTESEYGVSWDQIRLDDQPPDCYIPEGCNGEIYFARISTAGTQIGNDARITYSSHWVFDSSLAWTGSQYGVSWVDDRDGNNEIYFARISSTGSKIGSDVRITNSAGNSENPSLVWIGSEFGVSWYDNRDGNEEIYFARISATGTKIGSDIRITNAAGNSIYPSLAWTGAEYVVSWGDNRDGNPEIYFARISAGGSKIGDDVRITNDPNSSGSPSLIKAGSEYGLSWSDNRDGNYEIYFTRIGCDSDNDGLADNWENIYGCMQASTVDNLFDYDSDGLNNQQEHNNDTDPCDADTDNDNLNDGEEVNGYLTNPLSGDSDNDGLGDYLEAVTVACLDSSDNDTDNDGLLDGTTSGEDQNNNGIVDSGETDPCNPDTDGDGMPDGWERSYQACVNPLVGDSLGNPDGDVYSNFQEYQYSGNPCASNACSDGLDNDGDGFADMADPGCVNAADSSEYGAVACDDGVDNDSDGYTDWPDDLECNDLLDASELFQLTLAGSFNPYGGYAQDVYVSGNYAYVAYDGAGLRIIDITNPSAPTLIGSYNTPGYTLRVYVSGDFAYLADSGSGLQVINVATPAAPIFTGTYDTPHSSRDVFVSGGYAYVADGDAGLQIINVYNPASPTLAGAYDTPGYAYGVYFSGNYAYVADGVAGLKIINVSNPASPTLAGAYNIPDYASDVYVIGNFAYVADGTSGLQIINVSNPASPILAGTYNTPGSAHGVDVHGNYAYVADHNYGLQIINISGLGDADQDGLPNDWERIYSTCLDPRTADSGADPDFDGLTNLQEYQNSTLPCDADTDNDSASDGLEVLTALTDPLDPDSDDDLMFDGWEIAGASCGLDPLFFGDALLDSDLDTLENIHEFFNDNGDGNVSDPCDDTKPRRGAAGGGYFGEADGDLEITTNDMSIINLQLNNRSPNYSKVFPADPRIQDLDGDLEITTNDKSILSLILNGRQADYIAGSPTELTLAPPLPPPTVAVGDTVRIQVKLTNGKFNPSVGFGVVFTIVSGAGTLLGGEGVSGSGRYDLTALDGVAQMVVRADGSGTILVQVELPYDGEVHTRQVTMPDVPIDVLP